MRKFLQMILLITRFYTAKCMIAGYGNDLAVVWDSEDSATDLLVKMAHSISRFLAIRISKSSADQGEALSSIEVGIRDIEKQVQFLDEMNTHGQNDQKEQRETS